MIDLHNPNFDGAVIKISDADFASPNETGVEYGTPARGIWNIVHTGMLMPESHQIFVCAQGCLRGVVLTAAEMGASEKFSTIAVCEHNMLDGDMETLIIDGVTNVLEKLSKRRMPRAVLVFTSCIHHFMGCDLDFVYAKLREKFPGIYFTDCYMNPIMRKTKTPPDPMMRMRLYSFLKKSETQNPRCVNIIGNNYATSENADFKKLLKSSGFTVLDITEMRTFNEYERMSQSALNIGYMPAALPALNDLKERLSMDYLYIPLSYDYGEIRENLRHLADKLNLNIDEAKCDILEEEAENALAHAVKALDGRPVAIDYTATPRPLGLARLLLTHGANVKIIYADAFISEEKEAFEWLQAHYPSLELSATVHPKMALLPRPASVPDEYLAIGQKAAYFKNTDYFVNMLEGANSSASVCSTVGHWGYDAIISLARDICDAVKNKKEARRIIQVKGWGCTASGCCGL